MEQKLLREVKILKFYSAAVTIAVLALFYLVLIRANTTTFGEISVERINVVEKSGDLKLVISNSVRQHAGIVNGKAMPVRERPAGMIFFNSVGDECGGLVYDGNDKEAGMVLSVDKFRDDQIMQLQYMEDTKSKERKYGIQLWDYPKENSYDERNARFDEFKKAKDEKTAQLLYDKIKADSLLMEGRLFLGKNFKNDVGLFINDKNGKPRIKIFIDNNNNPKLEFYDDKGGLVDSKR